jgi:hypothetical protein
MWQLPGRSHDCLNPKPYTTTARLPRKARRSIRRCPWGPGACCPPQCIKYLNFKQREVFNVPVVELRHKILRLLIAMAEGDQALLLSEAIATKSTRNGEVKKVPTDLLLGMRSFAFPMIASHAWFRHPVRVYPRPPSPTVTSALDAQLSSWGLGGCCLCCDLV